MAQVKNWLTGETILEYEGDLKTALVEAVQAGKILRHADLRSANLRSADLRSANLRSADLRSADLGYANLGSADLGSANLGSHPIVVGGLRSDGYQFMLTNFPETGLRIQAGCRDFKGIERAREHWAAKGGTLGAESLAILDHMLNLARIRGIVPPPEPVTVTRTVEFSSNGNPKKPAKRTVKKKPARKKVAAKK